MSSSRCRSSLWLLVVAACAAPAANTPSEWPAPPEHLIATSAGDTAAERHAYDEHFKRAAGHHFVNMFLGVVANRREENGETVGIDYEYRITEDFGAGAFFDWSLGTLRTGILGPAFYWHPLDRLVLLTGPGLEIPTEAHKDTKLLWRAGGFYEFVAGEITVAPALFVDFVEGGEWTFVLGLNFGKRW